MATKKIRVLVIDDDEKTSSFIAETLGQRGIAVTAVADPFDGIEKAREEQPALIFVSLLLGESNGLKVSKAIHSAESLRSTPVVVLISFQGELDPKYTATIGIVDVMVKPLVEKEFISKTLELLERYGSLVPESSGRAAEPGAEEVGELHELAEEDVQEADLVAETAVHDDWETFLEATKGGEERMQPEDSDLKHDFGLPGEQEEREQPDLETAGEDAGDVDGGPVFEDDLPTQKKGPGAKVIIAVAAAICLAGIIAGAFFAKRFFFSDSLETALQKPAAPKGEEKVITENLPPLPAAGTKTGGVTVTELPVAGPAGTPAGQAGAEKPAVPAATAQSAPKSEAGQSAKKPETTLHADQTTVPAAAASGKKGKPHVLQIGLFAAEQNAAGIAEKLHQKGYVVSVKKEQLADGLVRFRVLAGPFESREKALVMQRTLKQKEGITTLVRTQ